MAKKSYRYGKVFNLKARWTYVSGGRERFLEIRSRHHQGGWADTEIIEHKSRGKWHEGWAKKSGKGWQGR